MKSTHKDAAAGRAGETIPRYVLYGDPDANVELDFLHVETISERSRVNNWEIQPHRHIELLQLLMIVGGGGEMRCDELRVPFRATSLIVMPPTVVHGFHFAPDTAGHVLTVSERFVDDVLGARADAQWRRLLAQPAALAIDAQAPAARLLPASFAAIAEEFVGHLPARITAIAAHLGLILAGARRLAADDTAPGPPDGEADVFQRFRQQIERRFREHWGVAEHAAALGVSDSRLTALCRHIAGRSPLALIHARVLAEAKRDLLYTSMSVAEVAYALGFQDPAYFSRFFSHQAREAPAAYRRRLVRDPAGP